MTAYRRQWEKDDITCWNFGRLPENIELMGKHGLTGYAYPALQVTDSVINLRLFSNPQEAAANHLQGVAALYDIFFADKLKQLKKNITLSGELKNWAVNIGNPRQMEQSIMNRVKKDLFYQSWRSSEEFISHADTVNTKILQYGQQVVAAITPVLKSFTDTYDLLQKLMQKNRMNNPVLKFLKSTRADLHDLVPINFPELYAFDRLRDLPRYLKALSIRAERGSLNLAATETKLQDVAIYAKHLQEIMNNVASTASVEKKNKTDELYWMIEEYKVSLFAQELKTPYPVSPKRLQQLIQEIENIIY